MKINIKIVFVITFLMSICSFGQGISYDAWHEKMENAKMALEEGNTAIAQRKYEGALNIVKYVLYGLQMKGGSEADQKTAIEKLRETLTPLVSIYVDTKNYVKLFGIAEQGVQVTNFYFSLKNHRL